MKYQAGNDYFRFIRGGTDSQFKMFSVPNADLGIIFMKIDGHKAKN